MFSLPQPQPKLVAVVGITGFNVFVLGATDGERERERHELVPTFNTSGSKKKWQSLLVPSGFLDSSSIDLRIQHFRAEISCSRFFALRQCL